MPKIFNDIANYFPLMDYPKWVDMEFIVYPKSLKKDIQPGANYAINFHGKIIWSKLIFGEAGFGYKAYEYSDLTIRKYTGLRSFYGTMGLGINF
jgi:hypothetical protein